MKRASILCWFVAASLMASCEAPKPPPPTDKPWVLQCWLPRLRAHFANKPYPLTHYGVWMVTTEEPLRVDEGAVELRAGSEVGVTGECITYNENDVEAVR